MFLKEVMRGYVAMVNTSNDLERLQYAPAEVVNGVFKNFKGNVMFGGVVKGLETLNMKVLKDLSRVTDATRCTNALKSEYNKGFETLLDAIVKNNKGGYELAETVEETNTIVDRLLNIVETGDKKAYREIRAELKEQWFALDNDVVADAILDLADAVADKDVDFANEILDRLDLDDEPTEDPLDTTTPEGGNTTANEDMSLIDEIIEDIKNAIDEQDEEDFKKLIDELKEEDPKLAKEWSTKFTTTSDTSEDAAVQSLVDEIVEDLEKALEDKDLEELQLCLEDLADEVGKDSSVYVEWQQKITATFAKTARRERRSRK